MKIFLKNVLFFSVVCVLFKGGVVFAAGSQVDFCGCYSGNYGDFTNKLVNSTYLYSEQDCNQYCANNKTKVYHWTVLGSSSSVTATPGGTYQAPPAHRCSCSNDGSTATVKNNAVNDANGCIFVCSDANTKKYNLDDTGWMDIPAQASQPQPEKKCDPACGNGMTCVKGTCKAVSHETSAAGDTVAAGGTGNSVTDPSGLVKCGRTGQPMCTLCDLIVGVNVIINYILGIAAIAAIAVIFIAGVMYVISGADPSMTGKAKSAIGNALLGIIIIVSAWLLVNYTMIVIGRKENLGVTKITDGWNNFTCSK